MTKQTSAKKKTTKGTTSTVSKGKIVERIAALMHNQPGLKVELNRYLPPINGKGRKREIDVLLTVDVAGYPVQMAIECKNEEEPIGSPKIDAFFGKLDYVGIPSRHGIYISASGYTSGAIERATDAGIRPLTLQGLTDENLFGSIAGAFQSIIYLLPQIVSFHVANEIQPDNPRRNIDALSFYNKEGKLVALLPDFIWRMWLSGNIPTTLGEHELAIPLPSNLYQMVNGSIVATYEIGAKVRVIGVIVTLEGKAKEYRLLNAANESVEKSLVEVSFEANASGSNSSVTLPITVISSEDQFQEFSYRPGSIQLTIGRIKLPRISNGPIYWPPSERVAKKLRERWHAFEAGEIPDLQSSDLQGIEGTDLQSVWEPIWKGHPAGHKN
jgi:hypothetical protein